MNLLVCHHAVQVPQNQDHSIRSNRLSLGFFTERKQNAKLLAKREDLKLQCRSSSEKDSAAANNADNTAEGQN